MANGRKIQGCLKHNLQLHTTSTQNERGKEAPLVEGDALHARTPHLKTRVAARRNTLPRKQSRRRLQWDRKHRTPTFSSLKRDPTPSSWFEGRRTVERGVHPRTRGCASSRPGRQDSRTRPPRRTENTMIATPLQTRVAETNNGQADGTTCCGRSKQRAQEQPAHTQAENCCR